MRTTLAIADDILAELRALAHARKTSVTKAANVALRAGLAAIKQRSAPREPYHEPVVDMGVPAAALTKALALAAEIEDEEVLRKLELRK